MRESGEPGGIALVLFQFAEVALAQGQFDAAAAYCDEGLQLCPSTKPTYWTPLLMQIHSEIALARREYTQAWGEIEATLAICRELRLSIPVTLLLEGVAGHIGVDVIGSAAELQRITHIWGAVEAQREANGLLLSARRRARFEQSMRLAHERLEPHVFAKAWAEGRAMTLEQVTDCVKHILQQ
jgi:hypothetical protein